MQQQVVTQPNPPQMSRLQASRPGGLLTPQQQQQLRQFLPPQSAQPQLPPFSPLQQQQLQQQLWQQQQKGVLSPQGGFQPGQTNGQPLFSRPNLRAFGPAPGGAQASFQGLEPPKLSSSLSAAAAPWPGSQGRGNGGAYGQMVRPLLLTLELVLLVYSFAVWKGGNYRARWRGPFCWRSFDVCHIRSYFHWSGQRVRAILPTFKSIK